MSNLSNMNEFSLKSAFEWVAALVVMLGGTGSIILALSKWFGDRFANKLLESDKAKYQQELEAIKSKFQSELESDKAKYQKELEGVKIEYQSELERKKAELEKSKALFFRYSEHQFSLYNELWKTLCDLKQIGEELWEKAEQEKVKDFSEQLAKTKLVVEKSALLIEDDHYKELTSILENFANFSIGKERLINLRNRSQEEINQNTVNRVIRNNGENKKAFTMLLNKLLHSFKVQIKGE